MKNGKTVLPKPEDLPERIRHMLQDVDGVEMPGIEEYPLFKKIYEVVEEEYGETWEKVSSLERTSTLVDLRTQITAAVYQLVPGIGRKVIGYFVGKNKGSIGELLEEHHRQMEAHPYYKETYTSFLSKVSSSAPKQKTERIIQLSMNEETLIEFLLKCGIKKSQIPQVVSRMFELTSQMKRVRSKI